MILHTVKTSPLQTFALSDCLNMLSADDSLLLMEDAVVATHACQTELFTQLQRLDQQQRLYVLASDLDARGIKNKLGQCTAYADFVELVIAHHSQLAW